jgi:hypothetical protein
MSLPPGEDLRELLAWQPPLGVLSVYLSVDHGDRNGGWKIGLADGLRAALGAAEADGDHELRLAARATADRIQARFSDEAAPPSGRSQVGFVEVGREPGREQWWSSLAGLRQDVTVTLGPRPHVRQLVELLDDHRRRGAVAISGERARVFESEEAGLSTLLEVSLETADEDWRERKAPRTVDVARGTAVSSSGRDQHEQRIDAQRQRFVDQVGAEVTKLASERGWEELLCFADAKHVTEICARLPADRLVHSEEKNLTNSPESAIAARIEELNPELNRAREERLIASAEEAALAGGRGALGLLECAQALAEGRVGHLLLASETLPAELEQSLVEALSVEGAVPDVPVAELLIERALATGARVTPAEGPAAERLAERDGVAAILRY